MIVAGYMWYGCIIIYLKQSYCTKREPQSMYKSASRFMCGIRLGIGTSLKREKKKQDLLNGIEIIKIEPCKVVAKAKKKEKLYQNTTQKMIQPTPSIIDNKLNLSQVQVPSTKPNDAEPDVSKPTKKKKGSSAEFVGAL